MCIFLTKKIVKHHLNLWLLPEKMGGYSEKIPSLDDDESPGTVAIRGLPRQVELLRHHRGPYHLHGHCGMVLFLGDSMGVPLLIDTEIHTESGMP